MVVVRQSVASLIVVPWQPLILLRVNKVNTAVKIMLGMFWFFQHAHLHVERLMHTCSEDMKSRRLARCVICHSTPQRRGETVCGPVCRRQQWAMYSGAWKRNFFDADGNSPSLDQVLSSCNPHRMVFSVYAYDFFVDCIILLAFAFRQNTMNGNIRLVTSLSVFRYDDAGNPYLVFVFLLSAACTDIF